MNTNKPQIHPAGNAIRLIQGSPTISRLSQKHSHSTDTNPAVFGAMLATVGAYQADE